MTGSSNSSKGGIPRIAVDVMGGDFAPRELVRGAVEGAQRYGVQVLLVGDKSAVEAELQDLDVDGAAVTVVPSEGRIPEDEHPVMALRKNPRASVAVATGLIKEGKADAMVSMGSTGAAMASAALGLGLLKGLERPCVGGPFVGLAPQTAILDLGSNIDCRPHQLLSFAVMGCVFARKFFGIDNPRVGLLSVGKEEGKGNRLVREAYPLFKDSNLNFIGNLEGMDILTGKANVVVCDGFVGNILLKFAEGLGDYTAAFLRERLRGKLPDQEVEALAESIWDLTNQSRKMSGPFFGVNGNVIVGHGASRSQEVAGAIKTAKRCVELDLANSIRRELALFEAAIKTPQNVIQS